MAISQEQVKVPGLPLQARDQLVTWPLPRPATVTSRGGWRRHAAHETRQGQAALAACGVGWDPATHDKKKQTVVPAALAAVSGGFVKVCPPGVPGSGGWLGVIGDSHPGGEEEESRDALLEAGTAHEATETGQKECGEENQPIPRDPQDPGTPGLSAEKTVYSSCLVCPSPSATLGCGHPRAAIQGPQAAWGVEGWGHRRGLGHCS